MLRAIALVLLLIPLPTLAAKKYLPNHDYPVQILKEEYVVDEEAEADGDWDGPTWIVSTSSVMADRSVQLIDHIVYCSPAKLVVMKFLDEKSKNEYGGEDIDYYIEPGKDPARFERYAYAVWNAYCK